VRPAASTPVEGGGEITVAPDSHDGDISFPVAAIAELFPVPIGFIFQKKTLL